MADNHGEDGHHHHLRESETYYAARTKALELLFREKNLIGIDTVDRVIRFFEHDMGPFNGAKVVARAWTDLAFKQRLLANTNAAIAELGLRDGIEGENLMAVECTPDVHHMVACTLCSCWPWPLLGLPPDWFKDPVFRARVVRDPRGVLGRFRGRSSSRRSGSRSGIAVRRSATSWCPSVPPAPKVGARRSWRRSISTEAMQGLGPGQGGLSDGGHHERDAQ